MFSLSPSPFLISWLVCAQALLSRIGPYGGRGGRARDILVAPHRLENVTSHSGDIVDSLAFSYTGHDGQLRSAGPWGGRTGSVCSTVSNPDLIFNSSCMLPSMHARLLCCPVVTYHIYKHQVIH